MQNKVLIIAEAGINHNGDLGRAVAMIDAAADAGADIVKFQSFHTDKLVHPGARRARYQIEATGVASSQADMLKPVELSLEQVHRLYVTCAQRGIGFMSTAFDPDSCAELVALAPRALKVASGDITTLPLLAKVAESRLPVYLSTGMSTPVEIERALDLFAFVYANPGLTPASNQAFCGSYARNPAEVCRFVTLLHCVSEYPTPPERANLRAISELRSQFGLPVGFSDHTVGLTVPIAAASLGATVIEKHFTLDRALPGPDHKASLTPPELAEMVAGIRVVERALGSGEKVPTADELSTRQVARKGLYAACRISAGEIFTAANLVCLRPLHPGRDAADYFSVLGTRAERDYAGHDAIGLSN